MTYEDVVGPFTFMKLTREKKQVDIKTPTLVRREKSVLHILPRCIIQIWRPFADSKLTSPGLMYQVTCERTSNRLLSKMYTEKHTD